MHELGSKLKVHHFGWEMLSVGIMQCNTAVLGASNEQVAARGVGESLKGYFVKLSESFGDTSLFNVEYSHYS